MVKPCNRYPEKAKGKAVPTRMLTRSLKSICKKYCKSSGERIIRDRNKLNVDKTDAPDANPFPREDVVNEIESICEVFLIRLGDESTKRTIF